MPLRTLHRISAFVLIAFSVLHIGNHLASLQGVAAHVSLMSSLRLLYRHPLVEPVLLWCVLFQVASGLRLVIRGWAGRSGRVAWLQAASGLYLALFLSIHVGAVLVGRAALDLDTNFYFAAAGFHVPPFQWFFAPYYALAVVSLFAHIGCALYWQFHERRPTVARALMATAVVTGCVASGAITLSLAGKIQPVNVPAEYKAPYPML